MNETILFHQTTIRLSIFVGLLLLLSLFEMRKPRLQWSVSKVFRWVSNLGLTLINTIVRFFAFITPVSVALMAQQNGWGLFNQITIWEPLVIFGTLLLLDLLIYWQHVFFHKIPLFWRLHCVHHTDPNFDVSTAIRFHPVEILLSLILKMGAIVLLGIPAISVLIFEVILNACSLFNHSNLDISEKWDRWIRRFMVTPDMHRVHHSILLEETHSNFGFNFPWWDHLFGTYRFQPKAGHEKMAIGMAEFQKAQQMNLLWLLWLPFKNTAHSDSSTFSPKQ